MKKSQFIQYGIIVAGILFGYKFFESLVTMIGQLVFEVRNGEDIGDFLLPYLLIVILYGAAFILLIQRSGTIASYLVRNQSNENLAIRIGKQSLLQVVLIGAGIITIITNIPGTVSYLFAAFKKEVGNGARLEEIEKIGFRAAAIEIIVALTILYFHREISSWFLKKQDANELIFESEEEKR